MPNRTGIVIPALIIVAMAVAGCASSATLPPASPQSSSPSSQPTTTESTFDPADPTLWTIGDGSVGPLSIGEGISGSLPQLASYKLAPPESCDLNPSMRIFESSEYPTLWVSVDTHDSERIRSIVVGSDVPVGVVAGPRTVAGIGIGTPEAEMFRAYPDAVKIAEIYGAQYAVSDGGSSSLVLSIQNGEVFSIQVDTSPTVQHEFCG